MNIIVHRGTNQIGGCITEIQTKTTRIIIDMGLELPDEEGNVDEEPLLLDGITKGEKNCDAVFFTHYHGDHIGMINNILPGVPMYMGKAAKEIYHTFEERKKSETAKIVEKVKTFRKGEKIRIGDITVTPFMVDHSAYDAYMFLVEADGKKVLHTGDFRTHGFRGKGVIPTLEKYVKNVDVLITEGTTLSRDTSNTKTERELQQEFMSLLTKYKYVFAITASTNIDRIASLHEATPRGKYFLCDRYQKKIIEIARKYGSKYTSLYSFKKALNYDNVMEKARNLGFCMLVRSGGKFIEIMKEYRDAYNSECLVIYSMWKGYLEQPNSKLKSLMEGFQNVVHLHTSGHADLEAILDVCKTVTPSQAIIPIHSVNPKRLDDLNLPYHIEYLEDAQVYEVK